MAPPATAAKSEEVPWDIFDRCLLPVIFSHAAAVILSTVLNVLHISQVSTFTLFILFTLASIGGTIFYHNLKVTAAGKAVFVTGCESRVGYAITRQLDDIGFTVFAGFDGHNEDAKRLKEESSGRVHTLQLDVTSPQQIAAAVRYVGDNLPDHSTGLWALINQSSVMTFGEVEWVPIRTFQETVNVNLIGTIRVSQAFLPLLRKSKGRLVNVISLLGRVPAPFRASFCAAQAGVDAFSQVLRLEMSPWGVDVVLVQPGDVTTGNTGLTGGQLLEQSRDMWTQLSPEVKADYGENYFEQKVRDLEKYTKIGEVELTSTLRSLTDSVCRTFPMQRYTPLTRAEKIQSLVSDHLPRSVYDIIYT